MPAPNAVGPMSANFGAGGGISNVDLAALYLVSNATVVGGHVTAITDPKHGLNLAATGNLVYNAADALLNNQPSYTSVVNNYLSIAAAIVPLGATRTVAFWGVTDAAGVGERYCTFGSGTLIACMFKNINPGGGLNTFTYTDNVAADNHNTVVHADVTPTTAVATLQTITIGAVSTFSLNGVDKPQSGNNIAAETGNSFVLGGSIATAFWTGRIGGLAVFNTFGAKELAFWKKISAQFGFSV